MSVEIEEKAARRAGTARRPEPRHEPLVFERSGEGKVGYSLPPLDVPAAIAIPETPAPRGDRGRDARSPRSRSRATSRASRG